MQQAAPIIKDDVSIIDRSLLKARKTFQTGITRPLAYRLKQL